MDRWCLCGRAGEDGSHLFFRCNQVKEVWRSAGLEAIRCQLSLCTSAKETVRQILQLNGEARLKSIFILNKWWHERNAVREGDMRSSADHIAMLSGQQTLELTKMESPAPGLVCRHGRRRWQRPQQGVLKLNVDGSFKIQEASGGWGYVIRDESGAVIQSGWGRKDFACSTLHMEPLACLQGLGAANNLAFKIWSWRQMQNKLLKQFMGMSSDSPWSEGSCTK